MLWWDAYCFCGVSGCQTAWKMHHRRCSRMGAILCDTSSAQWSLSSCWRLCCTQHSCMHKKFALAWWSSCECWCAYIRDCPAILRLLWERSMIKWLIFSLFHLNLVLEAIAHSRLNTSSAFNQFELCSVCPRIYTFLTLNFVWKNSCCHWIRPRHFLTLFPTL